MTRNILILLILSSCSTPEKRPVAPTVKQSKSKASLLTKKQVPKKIELTEEEIATNKKAIQYTIKKQNKFIGNCYGDAILTKGSEHLKGTMMIGFEIDPTGRAHAPRVLKDRSNLHSSELQDCLISGLKTWDFPVATKGTEITVNYPFIFQDKTPKNMQNKMDEFQKIMKNR